MIIQLYFFQPQVLINIWKDIKISFKTIKTSNLKEYWGRRLGDWFMKSLLNSIEKTEEENSKIYGDKTLVIKLLKLC